ncbi:ACP S-malonyltransferase [Hymenobacter busanensis]|uniref:Malonyl CoA-acyl carrier protein transacylase n=1 Tax=Hymenobacter busanensis TaxID=2607656 RepID=A0A7L4ZUK9_9BACT|nr:ACP S-malonyltransferase [Hymenobacter busanensis]KAA9339124.1 ACP S-malonyltransferase [Hymenobacter busanensis]QHJ07114.1 ACP S-malonyltransferase [Hymenobacter busanensis]
MKAVIFPGQGSQFPGMGRELYQQHPEAQRLMVQANDILGFSLTDIMFSGSDEDLRRTDVTQPAIFLHSVALFSTLPDLRPDMVAGHSLGEFSALVAAGVLQFDDALRLVAQRAQAMQAACQEQPGTMAAILGLDDATVERICQEITQQGNVVVAANYNCPGQLVISGSQAGIEQACEALKAAGAKRALPLPVGGAFHSPLMQSAEAALAQAIERTTFSPGRCPVYQNVDAAPHTNPDEIRQNLVRQLTAPVRWTQSVQRMAQDGATEFVECGPGKVLQGLVKKIAPQAAAASAV